MYYHPLIYLIQQNDKNLSCDQTSVISIKNLSLPLCLLEYLQQVYPRLPTNADGTRRNCQRLPWHSDNSVALVQGPE